MTITINGTTGISGVDGSAGTPSLQGQDTNTGFFYGTDILGFSTGGSERMRLDSSGNLGLGVTPVTGWNSSAKVLQFSNGTIWNNGGTTVLGSNVSFNSSYSPYYIGTNLAGAFVYNYTGSGGFQWLQAPSGTAGSLITFTQAMTLDASGRLGVGTSSPASAYRMSLTGDGSTIVGGLALTSSGNTAYVGQVGGTSADCEYWNAANGYVRIGTNNSERMRIDSSGNVGIGTSSPGLKLDVSGSIRAGGGWLIGYRGTGGYAALSTAQNTTSGGCIVVRDDASSYNASGMEFYTGTSERMRIDSGGNLLVGTTSFPVTNRTNGFSWVSNGYLQIRGPGSQSQWAINSTSGVLVYFYSDNGSGSVYAGAISLNGNTTSYTSVSDYRLKENIQPMTGALEKVAKLNPVTFNFKDGGQKSQGFIAHELQAVVPDCVTGEKDAVDKDGNPVYQGVDTSFLVATLTKAIQELTARVIELEKK